MIPAPGALDAGGLFDPGPGIYLLNHSVGRPPCSVQQALTSGLLEPWFDEGESVWPRWLESIQQFRDSLARLLGAPAANFCPQTNLSSALTKILLSRPVDPARPVILCTEHDFPSMVFVLDRMQRHGYRLRIIRGGAAEMSNAANWTKHLTSDVGAVLISHVHSNTGTRVPVADITAQCRELKILSTVDIAQSVGIIPIDLAHWGADFVLGSCVKWLCGGPGAGFLYAANEALAQSEPSDVGWFSHEDPFEFDIESFRYADDALRFWGGTPSVAPFVIAANSINMLANVGIARVRQHNVSLTDILLDAIDPSELVSPVTQKERGGTVVVAPHRSRFGEVLERLNARHVGYDQRSSSLRLSPHIYNTEEQLELVAECFAS